MSQDTPRAGGNGEREQLVAGIEQSRQDLVRTVRALSAKVDVPTRVRGRAAEMRERTRPALVYGAAGVCAAAALLALSRRKRS